MFSHSIRKITFVFVALPLLALLIACGGDEDDEPIAAAAGTATSTAIAASQPPTATASAPSAPTATATPTDEAAPAETSEPEPTPTETQAGAADPTATEVPPTPLPPTPEPEPTATPEPAGPVAVLGGVFEEINYSGSGDVTVYRNPDGSHTVAFSNFVTEGGPELVVYLSATSELNDGAILSADFINLGALQSTEGYQEYFIPTDIDPAQWASIVVWCAAFDTGFVGAVLG